MNQWILTICGLAAILLSVRVAASQTPQLGSRFLSVAEIQALISGNVRVSRDSRGREFTEEYSPTGLLTGRGPGGWDGGHWRAVQGPRGNATLCTRFDISEGGGELCTEIMVGPDRTPRWPNGAVIGLQRY